MSTRYLRSIERGQAFVHLNKMIITKQHDSRKLTSTITSYLRSNTYIERGQAFVHLNKIIVTIT